jgi:hypothetical protein
MGLAFGLLGLLFLGTPRIPNPYLYWTPTAPLPLPYTRMLTASPSDDRVLYALGDGSAGERGLFRSDNGGESWLQGAEILRESSSRRSQSIH